MNNVNNSNQKKGNIISPENAVFIVPVLIGLSISFFIGLFLFRPLLARSNKYLELVKSYENKKTNLLSKAEQLRFINSNLKKYQDQKSFLIQLIGGTRDLKTLLAIINKVANDNNIVFIEIDPLKIKRNMPNNQTEDNLIPSEIDNEFITGEISNDPLIIEEVEQHNAVISINGYFNQIISFLRDLEAYENIIISNGIDLKVSQHDNQSNNSTKLNFKTFISAYGLLPKENVSK